ncbi:MAG: CPBP family intramembrane metalloprotease [Alphaproteobacteria bacterium]|nr:MAG: CPBP family intramembrane metalloprotease [Alphaproteobacteria bacterium]
MTRHFRIVNGAKLVLGLEFVLLWLGVPTIILAFRLAPYMFVFLWSATAYCAWIYRRHFWTGWRDLWRWEAVRWDNLRPILIRWAICCVGLVILVAVMDPDRMFQLVRRRPDFVPFLLVLYPLLSALPQEFIFCSVFFKRYAPFFPSDRWRILASALTFAYAHVLFINWVAPVLSLVAGFIFARTFARTRSLALVAIEHGLYGNALFLVGLGWYFYGGAHG